MNFLFRWLFAFSLLFIYAGSSAQKAAQVQGQVLQNPLQVAFGDPYILYDSLSDRYYMYGTGGVEQGFMAYSSADLVNWKSEGQVYKADKEKSWGIGDFWAPEVFHRNGKYYLVFSAQWRVNPNKDLENFRVGVAVADHPTGPFREISDGPVFDPGYPIIDGDLLFEPDGRVFLYYSRCCYKHPVKSEIADWARQKGWYKDVEESWVYGVEIKPDFSGSIGEPVLLLQPPYKLNDPQSEWESRSVTAHEVNRRWTEGSYIFKNGNTYYMMYSSNHFGGEYYAIGYATSNSPLGPFRKATNNPVLQKNTNRGGLVTGTGHNSVLFSPDHKSMYCIYHGRTEKTGMERMVFIDKMELLKDGRLVVHGPTTTPQILPDIRYTSK